MGNSIVRGKYVITGIGPTGRPDLIVNGGVYQREGRVVEAGSFERLTAKYRPEVVLGSPTTIVFPGFVNAHHHVGLTPFQLGAPDLPLETWVVQRFGFRRVDPYLDTLYSAFELLESGVTTVQHIQFGRGPVEQWPDLISQVLRAYRDIGMRVSYSVALRDQSRIVYGADEPFLTSLPTHLEAGVRQLITQQVIDPNEHLRRFFVELSEASLGNAGPGVRFQLAPANLHWCSDSALELVRDCAERFDAKIHMHLLETPYQKQYARERTGSTAVQHLQRIGLLDERLTLGHGVWLSEREMDLIAKAGVRICHNPSSNLRISSGLAPVNEFLAQGIPVALGIDEAGINDDRDMLQEMRLALNLHRVPGLDSKAPTSAQVLKMATATGATTTAFGSEVGSLCPGSFADMVLLDWAQITSPYLEPGVDVVDAVLHRATVRSVEAVIVGGAEVYRGGRFTRVNRARVLKELAEQMTSEPDSDLLGRRQLVEQLMPYVRAFYRDRLPSGRQRPYYQLNSRS